jgi:hypothetical protein
MKTAAVESSEGGAAVPRLELRRARLAVASSADHLARVCRDHAAPPDGVAAAERVLSDAFAVYGGLVLLARSTR